MVFLLIHSLFDLFVLQPVNVSTTPEKVEPVTVATKEHGSGWLEDLDDDADEEDFHLLYNSYAGDDVIFSDSKVN